MDATLIQTPKSLWLKKISTKKDISENDKESGYLICSNEKNTRSILASLKDKKINKKIFVVGNDNTFNRRIIETCKIHYLVSPENGPKKDTLKQRDSGLNHVLAKIANEKNIGIVINFSEIDKLTKKEKALKLSRIIQNIKICRKINCKIKIATFASSPKEIIDDKSLKSFCFSLGMNSSETKNCLNF